MQVAANLRSAHHNEVDAATREAVGGVLLCSSPGVC